MAAATPPGDTDIVPDWRQGLPTLRSPRCVLRELRMSDAASLCALLTAEEVSQFISPPPTTVAGFERFIGWAARQRVAGSYACFALTTNVDTAIGVFQVRGLDPGSTTTEWGFAIGSPGWGTGAFRDGARMAVDFVFVRLVAHRLEARSVAENERSHRALLKLGAVPECVLRRSFKRDGEYFDQILYSILDSDWRTARALGADEAPVRAN